MDNSCFYCEDGELRKSLMLEVVRLKVSTLYLNRDQKHQGRCVLKFNRHKTDVSELTPEENSCFFDELAKVAGAIIALYHPDKINYAVYGDLVPHWHVHIVPKYKGGLQWGKPFSDDGDKKLLSDKEYEQRILALKNAVLSNLK